MFNELNRVAGPFRNLFRISFFIISFVVGFDIDRKIKKYILRTICFCAVACSMAKLQNSYAFLFIYQFNKLVVVRAPCTQSLHIEK